MTIRTYPDVGRVFFPQRTISIPGRPSRRKPANVVVATIRRPKWSIDRVFKLPEFKYATPKARRTIRGLLDDLARKIDPMLFMGELIWASISHNDRVQDGGDHNANRTFGTVGASNAAGTFMALAKAAVTPDNGDAAIENAAQGDQTSEHTDGGLVRVAATIQNYTAPASLDAVYDLDAYKSFSPSASRTAYGAAIFDQLAAAGSWMLCVDAFSSNAVVENGDTLNVTYTYQN